MEFVGYGIRKEIDRNICPLCETEASFIENETTFVNCPKCGKYTYKITVHPLLFETKFRNSIILEKLSNMAQMAYKKGSSLDITFELYQKIEKELFGL